jgi:hypothetical protein
MGKEISFYSTVSGLTLVSTQAPIQWAIGALFLGYIERGVVKNCGASPDAFMLS